MKQSSIRAFFLVLSTVVLGLISAWCLKETAQNHDVPIYVLVLVISIVSTVNAARFFIWGYIHRHYPISISYPLNSLFFPLILLLGFFYGEEISVMKILGVALITIGVAMLTYKFTPT